MRRAGLAQEVRVLPGDLTEEAGAHAVHALLAAGPLPSALVAGNDRAAVGALDVLRRSGMDVPGDVCVVGYDDSALARLAHVDLTTVQQDGVRMAQLAVAAAAERLDAGRERARDVVLDPLLVVRSTTGPLRGGAPEPAERPARQPAAEEEPAQAQVSTRSRL